MAAAADRVGVASWVLVWRALVGGVSVKELTAGPVAVDIGRAVRTGSVSVVEPTVSVMRSAGRLVVDPRIHADEIARFTSHIVRGPTASDCDIWISAIGADGYGRYYLTRQGMGLCVRPHRYALAMAAGTVGSDLHAHRVIALM